eukprot:TRINITY_DN65626_c0_g1_i1.p1 TRINITY_DN65626_c0_g1~~TRINITY_DN65626_c0_g1_i1.p1  ORF type:complete len:588 (+),score=222.99 TRINITY_DN65626_c0_g1_i1:35-1765(+)
MTNYKQQAARVFTAVDTNGSGRISASELSHALKDARIKNDLRWPGTSEQLLQLLAPCGGSLSQDMLARYYEVLELFSLIDDNNSGRVSPFELKHALQTNSVVREKLAVPPHLAPTLFSQIDTNGSGAVSFVEFFRHFTAAPLSKPFKPLGDYTSITEAIFKKIDLDRSGAITKDEFVRALKEDREVQLELGWPAHMAEQLFSFLDRDKSGDVSRNEFTLFCRAQWLFNNIDVNRSGYIDAYELGVALAKPEMQKELRIQAHHAKEVFMKMDHDGSGMVKFSEFYRWLAHQAKASPARGGYTAEHPVKQVPSRKNDQYTNVRKIGEGTFGDVYLCEHYSGEKLIKKVPKLQANESKSQFKQRMEEVLLEAKMLETYKHPNIVRYVDSYWEDLQGRSVIIIITEFCTGGDLRSFMKTTASKGGVTQRQVEDVFYQACCAIDFLHRGRLLHRDLKPDNMFLTGRSDRPIIKLGDFGLVKQMDAAQNTAMTVCGTMLYMAPEILKGQGYGMPNDVWALGCILYELALCNGSLAFRNVADVVKVNLPKNCPSWCADTVKSILREDPKKRPTVSELKRAFAH